MSIHGQPLYARAAYNVRTLKMDNSRPIGAAELGLSARDLFLSQRRNAIARFDSLNPLKHEEQRLGYLEASFLLDRFDSGRFAIESLCAAAERAHAAYARRCRSRHSPPIPYTAWPFPGFLPTGEDLTYLVRGGLETILWTKDLAGNDLLDFWRLHQTGFLYQRSLLRPTVQKLADATRRVAECFSIAVYVALAVDCLALLYDGLIGATESVTLHLRLLNSANRVLVQAPGTPAYVCQTPEILIERSLPLARWRSAVQEQAVEIVNEIYRGFNFQNPYTEHLREIIRMEAL